MYIIAFLLILSTFDFSPSGAEFNVATREVAACLLAVLELAKKLSNLLLPR